MNFKEFLSSNIVCLDGGMGTLLLEGGLKSGELEADRPAFEFSPALYFL